MSIPLGDQDLFEELEARLRAILPEEYQEHYDDVQPVSMGSALLKFGVDGKVAWGEIWENFCDLAMAGGPPHKGLLLQPGSREEIEAQPDKYRQVVDEICRGIRMAAEVAVMPSPDLGWVRVDCDSPSMAGWLLRAIVMENVSARQEGKFLDLPAGPSYRIGKEIKNVITVIAKTCHYWLGHMWANQQDGLAELFDDMDLTLPLLRPTYVGHDFNADAHQMLSGKVAAAVLHSTGLSQSNRSYPGWLGVNCPNVRAAVWMMRSMVAMNVLCRREETALFVPVNPNTDPEGHVILQRLAQVHRFAVERAIL